MTRPTTNPPTKTRRRTADDLMQEALKTFSKQQNQQQNQLRTQQRNQQPAVTPVQPPPPPSSTAFMTPEQLMQDALQTYQPPSADIRQSAVQLIQPALDALQFVTQPFQAPQQIMYGTFSGLIGLLTGNEEMQGDFLRGFKAAGSYATFGLLDQRRGQADALRAGEFIRRMGGSETMSTWGGIIGDLVLDPTLLVGGAGALLKTVGKAKATTKPGQIALKVSDAVLKFNDTLGSPVRTLFNLIPKGAELSIGAKVSVADALGLVQRGRFYVPTVKGIRSITRERLAAAFGSPILNKEFEIPSFAQPFLQGRTETTIGEFFVPQSLRRRLLPSRQAQIDTHIDNLRDLRAVRVELPRSEAKTAGQAGVIARNAFGPTNAPSGLQVTKLTGLADSELRAVTSGPRSVDDFVSVAPIDAMDRRVTFVLRARNQLADGLTDEDAQKAFKLAYLISDGKDLKQIQNAKDELVLLEQTTGKAGLYNQAMELVTRQVELDGVGGTLLEWSGMFKRGLGEGYEIVSANRRAFGLFSKYGDAYIEKIRALGKPRQVKIDGPYTVGKLVGKGYSQEEAQDILKDIVGYYGAANVAGKQPGTLADALAQSATLKQKYADKLPELIPDLVASLSLAKPPTALGYKRVVARSGLKRGTPYKSAQAIEVTPGSEDIAASLKTFRTQALKGADTGGVGPLKRRDYSISAARAQELAEIQDLAVAALEQAKGVGRAAAERSALVQLRGMVESEWGKILNTKNMKAWSGDEIKAFTEPGSGLREITQRDVDKYGVFNVGDVVPAIAYRAMQVYSMGAKSQGVGGIVTLQRLVNVWKATKLGTPGSIIRNLIGGASQYYTAGGNAIDHAAGMIEMLRRFNDPALRDEMLQAGLSLSSWSLAEATGVANAARAASVGVKKSNTWLDRLEEITGIAPKVTGEPTTELIAKLNPQRIGFDAFTKTEQLLKGGAYIAGRKSGMTAEEAAQFAEDVIFNYHARPLIAEFGSRSGADPFATFRIFAGAQILESLYDRPYRLAAVARVPYSADAGRPDPENVNRERASLDKYLQSQWTIPLMIRDQDGRMLYLPIRQLLNVGAVADQTDGYFDVKAEDVGGQVGYSVLKAVDQIMRNSPYAQLLTTVIAGRGFGGKDTYSSIGGGAFTQAAKQNPGEAVRLALIETMNLIGWPLTPGSPLAQRWAQVLERHIVDEEEAAAAAGLKSGQEFNDQALAFAARVLRNGAFLGGYGSLNRKPSPTSEPPEGATSVLFRSFGLPTSSVSTDTSKVTMSDTKKRMLEVKRQISALIGSGNPNDPAFGASELGQLARTVRGDDFERVKADILRRVAALQKELEELQEKQK